MSYTGRISTSVGNIEATEKQHLRAQRSRTYHWNHDATVQVEELGEIVDVLGNQLSSIVMSIIVSTAQLVICMTPIAGVNQ